MLQSVDEQVLVEYSLQQPLTADHFQKDKGKKVMTLSGLKDLQSRLMLIVGKEGKVKDSVDRFVSVIAANVLRFLVGV
jgi:hypothetical protein